jgi:hypothetical protein
MKTHLVSFSTPQYRRSQKALEASALKFGIDEVHSFTEKDLTKTDFYKAHQAIFKQARGYGFWLWKPFIILETLKKAEIGDIVLYLDAGNDIIADLRPLFDLCLYQDIVLFQIHTHKNKTWTKRDTFVFMDCDKEAYWQAEQVSGASQLYSVCQKSINFLESWLNFCENPHILTDTDNICGFPNYPEFKDHRHDQSVLSLLALKKRIKIHRDPSQYGNTFMNGYPNSQYGQLLNLHRTKKISLWEQILSKIKRMKKGCDHI